MNKNNFLVGVFIILLFSACGKYEEGKTISFRSVTSRVQGVWKIDKIIVDDIDSTAVYSSFIGTKLDLDEDFNWSFDESATMQFKGEWSFKPLKYYILLDVNETYYNNFLFTDSIIPGPGPFYNTNTIKWELMRVAKKELNIETKYEDRIIRFEMTLDEDY